MTRARSGGFQLSAVLAVVAVFAADLSLAATGCRPHDELARPAPEARPKSTAPAPPDSRWVTPSNERRVDATVVRWLGVGWADVIDLDLRGDLHGPASLWVPAGDASEKAILAGASKPGATLALVLEPLAAPDGGAGGPYALHVEQRGDGGVEYWRVKSTTLPAPAAPPAP